jgi:hypothetical protein
MAFEITGPPDCLSMRNLRRRDASHAPRQGANRFLADIAGGTPGAAEPYLVGSSVGPTLGLSDPDRGGARRGGDRVLFRGSQGPGSTGWSTACPQVIHSLRGARVAPELTRSAARSSPVGEHPATFLSSTGVDRERPAQRADQQVSLRLSTGVYTPCAQLPVLPSTGRRPVVHRGCGGRAWSGGRRLVACAGRTRIVGRAAYTEGSGPARPEVAIRRGGSRR